MLEWENERIPACPDCGEEGKKVRNNYWRCPQCKAVWQEISSSKKLTRKRLELFRNQNCVVVDSLVAVSELSCNVCAKVIKQEDRYCHRIDEDGIYCVSCALATAWQEMYRALKEDELHENS